MSVLRYLTSIEASQWSAPKLWISMELTFKRGQTVSNSEGRRIFIPLNRPHSPFRSLTRRQGGRVCIAAAAAPSKVYDPRRTARQTGRTTDRDRRNDHKATAKVTHARARGSTKFSSRAKLCGTFEMPESFHEETKSCSRWHAPQKTGEGGNQSLILKFIAHDMTLNSSTSS